MKICTIYLAGTAYMKNSLAFPQTFKHSVTLWLSNSTPRYIPKRNENKYPHKDSYMSVHSRIDNNSQKVETTQISIN